MINYIKEKPLESLNIFGKAGLMVSIISLGLSYFDVNIIHPFYALIFGVAASLFVIITKIEMWLIKKETFREYKK